MLFDIEGRHEMLLARRWIVNPFAASVRRRAQMRRLAWAAASPAHTSASGLRYEITCHIAPIFANGVRNSAAYAEF